MIRRIFERHRREQQVIAPRPDPAACIVTISVLAAAVVGSITMVGVAVGQPWIGLFSGFVALVLIAALPALLRGPPRRRLVFGRHR